MAFKNGDRVRVMSREELYTHKYVCGDYQVKGLLFNTLMFQYCGRIFEIRFQSETHDHYKLIGIEKNMEKPDWFFSEHMLTLVDTQIDTQLHKKLAMEQTYKEELL